MDQTDAISFTEKRQGIKSVIFNCSLGILDNTKNPQQNDSVKKAQPSGEKKISR